MALQVVPQDVEMLYNICASNPTGVSNKELQEHGWDHRKIMSCAKPLLDHRRIELSQPAGQPGHIVFRIVDPRLVDLDEEAIVVYREIAKAANKGCFARALSSATKVNTQNLDRVAKRLEQKRLIKHVKSVAHPNRKLYMLYDLEPDKAVSGGTGYRNGEFDGDWVDSLRESCLKFLESQGPKTPVKLEDLHAHLQTQPGRSPPTQEDVQHIMRTLELDDMITASPTWSGTVQYLYRGPPVDIFSGRVPRFLARAEPDGGGCSVPCLSCPLQNECCPGGRVSPEKCEYIGAWLRGGLNGKPGSDVPMEPLANAW